MKMRKILMSHDVFEGIREKIVPIGEIGTSVEKLRSSGKTIVTLNGAFDILHPGHIYFLMEAKKQGDILIVGLNSDASIRRNKGERRPINKEEDRTLMMASLPDVDIVTVFDEDTPLGFLEKVRPDVHCNGEEYGTDCIESETLKKIGARLHLIPRIEGYSTTDIAGKARKRS